MDVNCALSDNDALPYPFHNLLTREDMTEIREKQTEKVKLSVGELDDLAVYGDNLAVKIYLQAAKAKKTPAKASLDDIHYIVAHFLTFSDDIVINGTKGIRIVVVARF